MATSIKPLSIEDFEQLPAEMAEGHELVDGELIDVSGNTPNHNSIRDLLIALLLPWFAKDGSAWCLPSRNTISTGTHMGRTSAFSVRKSVYWSRHTQ